MSLARAALILVPCVFSFLAAASCGGGSSSTSGTGGTGTSSTTSTTSTTTSSTTSTTGSGGTGGAMMVCMPTTTQPCYTGPASTEGVGICKGGQKTCLPDGSGYGACAGEVTPLPAEDCTTPVDDDCNGHINDATAGCLCVPAATAPCYDGPLGTENIGLCHGGTKTCAADGKSFGPCAGEVLPQPETCNTPGDDNCNGQTNEGGPGCACTPGAASACYSGPASTMGVGPCHGGMQVCNTQGTGFGPCMGEVVPQPETCNTPIDDNCNGQVNEGGAGCVCLPSSVAACYTGPAGTQGVGICKAGTKTCNGLGTAYGACNGQVLPAAMETCNNALDDNCNGQVDEGCPVTYAFSVRPILAAHCASCHTTGGSGGVNFAAVYADSQLASNVCPGKTVGACTLVRIQDGSMPDGAGCTGNPAMDTGNAACLSASEQATIQAWITGGQMP